MMEVHHNEAAAELFRRMAEVERQHLAKIEILADGLELPEYAPWEHEWGKSGAPGSIPISKVHYLMVGHQAVSEMSACTERARAFYIDVSRTTSDATVREVALQLGGGASRRIPARVACRSPRAAGRLGFRYGQSSGSGVISPSLRKVVQLSAIQGATHHRSRRGTWSPFPLGRPP